MDADCTFDTDLYDWDEHRPKNYYSVRFHSAKLELQVVFGGYMLYRSCYQWR